jgi:hypothetical protein
MKIAGRDAGRLGVVIDVKDGSVLIDGQVRRREVSVAHVEPIGRSVDVAKNASTDSVREALKGIGVEFPEPFANKRPRVGGPKPVKQRAGDKKPVKAPRKSAKAPKKPAEKKTQAKPKKTSTKKPAEKVEPKSTKASEKSAQKPVAKSADKPSE